MFNLGKNIISGLLGLKKKARLSKKDLERYIPEPVRTRVAPQKAKSRLGRGLLTIIAAGIGVVGVIAGVGVTKAVKNKLTKKAVILVGEDGAGAALGSKGFNGYLLKFTELDKLEEMIDTLAANGFTEIITVPVSVINGYSVDRIKNITAQKRELFEKISCAPALLTSSDDYEKLAQTLIACAKDTDEDTAVVYVGKGTTHHSNSSYIALNERIKRLGGDNIFVGTATSYPDFDKVAGDIAAAHYQNVVLCPLEMTVDDELTEAIAGEENSWLEKFDDAGFNCACYMKGLCAYKGVRAMVVEHTKEVM